MLIFTRRRCTASGMCCLICHLLPFSMQRHVLQCATLSHRSESLNQSSHDLFKVTGATLSYCEVMIAVVRSKSLVIGTMHVVVVQGISDCCLGVYRHHDPRLLLVAVQTVVAHTAKANRHGGARLGSSHVQHHRSRNHGHAASLLDCIHEAAS